MPDWELEPAVLLRICGEVQPPCRGIFGASIFPPFLIVVVTCHPNCVRPSKEVIKVVMSVIRKGVHSDVWDRLG